MFYLLILDNNINNNINNNIIFFYKFYIITI